MSCLITRQACSLQRSFVGPYNGSDPVEANYLQTRQHVSSADTERLHLLTCEQLDGAIKNTFLARLRRNIRLGAGCLTIWMDITVGFVIHFLPRSRGIFYDLQNGLLAFQLCSGCDSEDLSNYMNVSVYCKS